MITLYKKELEDLKKYCQVKSLYQTTHFQKDSINECRGKYKGYLFGIKMCSYLISHKEHLNSVSLYNHVKVQRNNVYGADTKSGEYKNGLALALYDIQNYLADLKEE